MPKVELDVLLEGAIRPETLRIITEQNDIPTTFKQYRQWMSTFAKPDYLRMEPLLQTVANWFQQPDDLTRLVYDLGVSLAKQNVRYAEIGFIPTLYNNMTFEQVMTALNDGRSRVERGWNVKLAWVLQLPRNQIRRVDDIVRWATGQTARKNGIVGIGLMGRDDLPPVEDFERPFQNAHKKNVLCTVSAGDSRGVEGVLSAIRYLQPTRIVGGWGVHDSEEAIKAFQEQSVGLVVQMSHALAVHQVEHALQYPAVGLQQKGVPIILSTGMPTYYNTTLTQEYLMLAEQDGLTIDTLRTIGANAIQFSMLEAEEKAELLTEFEKEYTSLAV